MLQNLKVFSKLSFVNTKFYLVGYALVDFELKDHKVIIESMGPIHFLKPNFERMNATTEFKMKIFKLHGYNVIVVPFNSVEKQGKESMRLLYDQLKELKIVKDA